MSKNTREQAPKTSAGNFTSTCGHCGATDCAEHCLTFSDGEHRGRIVEVHAYDDELECFEIEVACTACGAEGHLGQPLAIDTIKDDILWDTRAWRGGANGGGKP